MAFTTAFSSLLVGGVPIVAPGSTIPVAGNVFFVNSVSGAAYPVGADGNSGALDSPLLTLSGALSKCVADRGDVIMLMPGYTQTISAAGGVDVSKAGVTIIGMGQGADRPTFTFSATASTFLVTAASVTIRNIIGTPSIDNVVSGFVVSAANVSLGTADEPIEWRDASSAIEATRAVLTTAAADNFTCNLVYKGFTGGNGTVNAIRLVGADNANITVDFYGVASTAVVEFVTTACTNVTIGGYFYNSGTTDLSKDVVDTITGSTWFANGYDGAAGCSFSGGSGAALAKDDISVVVANQAAPSANSTANATEADVTGNKTDTAVYVPGTTNSLAAYVKGTANLQERVAKKTAATLTNGVTLFTIAGGPIEIQALVLICETGNDATASTIQFSVTPTSGSAQTISGASASVANATAGASIALAGTALATAALYNANGPNLMANPGTILAPAGTVTAVVAIGSTTGTWAAYIRYKPLAIGVTVS